MKTNPPFEFCLPIENRKTLQWMHLLLLLISVAIAFRAVFILAVASPVWLILATLSLILALIKVLVPKVSHNILYISYLLIVIAWFGLPFFKFTGLLFIILGWLDYLQQHPKKIVVNEQVRIIDPLRTKTIQWDALDNVVLRNEWLTIDYKNNKLLQLKIDTSHGVDQEAFNAFCEQKLK